MAFSMCFSSKNPPGFFVDLRVHVRDVMAGMKAVIYRRTTSNSVGHLGGPQVFGRRSQISWQVLQWAELGGL